MINKKIYLYIYDLLSEPEKKQIKYYIQNDDKRKKQYKLACHNIKVIQKKLTQSPINPLRQEALLKKIKTEAESYKKKLL